MSTWGYDGGPEDENGFLEGLAGILIIGVPCLVIYSICKVVVFLCGRVY